MRYTYFLSLFSIILLAFGCTKYEVLNNLNTSNSSGMPLLSDTIEVLSLPPCFGDSIFPLLEGDSIVLVGSFIEEPDSTLLYFVQVESGLSVTFNEFCDDVVIDYDDPQDDDDDGEGDSDDDDDGYGDSDDDDDGDSDDDDDGYGDSDDDDDGEGDSDDDDDGDSDDDDDGYGDSDDDDDGEGDSDDDDDGDSDDDEDDDSDDDEDDDSDDDDDD